MKIKVYLHSVKSTIDVYTGTYEWLEYPGESGVTPIFLYIDGGERWLPAPKYYSKVCYQLRNQSNQLRNPICHH